MLIYRMGRFVMRVGFMTLYREIEVEGIERVPARGPVLFTLNHPNGVVDPLVLVVKLRRVLTLTAKSTLLKMPVIGQMMRLFQVVPIHRRQDQTEGSDPSKNVESLAACRARLAEGGAICIFPEGVSHSEPQMRPLKTGAARIALEYLEHNGNAGGLRIIPVGLHFECKNRIRSRVWARFGEPIDPARWKAENENSGAKELTAHLDEAMRRLTLNFKMEEESNLLADAAELLMTGGEKPPQLGKETQTLAERQLLIERLRQGYEALKRDHAVKLTETAERFSRFCAQLKIKGIHPSELFLPMDASLAFMFFIRQILFMVLGLPLAIYGLINHLLPWLTIRFIGGFLHKGTDQWASNVLYPSLVVFPAFYLLQIGTVAWFYPFSWAAVYGVTLPFAGWIALHYVERAPRIWRRSRTFLRFLFHPTERREMADEAQSLIQEIQNLDLLIAQGP